MFVDRSRACGKCGKAERVFCEAFPSNCGNAHQEKARRPILLRISTVASFSTGLFFFGSFFFY
jgi:hypothetical protein